MAENTFSSRFSPWHLEEFINLDYFKHRYKETVKFVQTCVDRRESWKTVREKLRAMDAATSSRTVENDAEFEKNRTLLSEYNADELEVKNYAIFLVIHSNHALLVAVPQTQLETVLKNTVKIVGNNNLATLSVPIDVNESAGLLLEVDNLDKRVELIERSDQLKFGSEIVRNRNVRDPSSVATIPCPVSTTLYYHVRLSRDKNRKAYKMCREHTSDIHEIWNCGSRRYFISFSQASIRDIDLLALMAVFKRRSNILAEMLKDGNALPVETLSAIYTATRSDCMEFAKTMCREFASEAGKDEGEIKKLMWPQHVLDGPWASFEISSRNNASSGYTVGATSTSARFSGAS